MHMEDIADRFEMVRMSGRGFTARCPAHNDRSPSLTVSHGLTGILVKCQVGCSFFDVVAAVGLQPLDFKYEVHNSPSTMVTSRAKRVMEEMRHWKQKPLVKFYEIVDVALEPTAERLVEVCTRYPEIMFAGWREASKMWVVAMDGPIYDTLYLDERYRGDWSTEKQILGRILFETQRRYGTNG